MANVKNGTLQECINNAAVGEVLTLTENISLVSRVKVANVVILDLNGFSITANLDDPYGALYVSITGELSIKDSSVVKTGSIINTGGCAIGNYGVVNIYNGTISGNYALYNFYYSDTTYGKATINGGTLKTTGELAIANSGDLIVNNGIIDSIDTTHALDIHGGTIGSLYVGVADYGPPTQSTEISGGTVTDFVVADNSGNDIVISGGQFNCVVDNKYLADGCKMSYDPNTGKSSIASEAGLKVIATSSSRLKDLVIRDGQLIFIQDRGRIAFDFKGKRKFYNQITELDNDQERITMVEPSVGYYFVISSACLWYYQTEWVQITTKPDAIVFIGVELPELGKEGTLYVDKDDKEISVWDEESNDYIVVADYTNEISADDIENLFS